jgi:hypothetical protein
MYLQLDMVLNLLLTRQYTCARKVLAFFCKGHAAFYGKIIYERKYLWCKTKLTETVLTLDPVPGQISSAEFIAPFILYL